MFGARDRTVENLVDVTATTQTSEDLAQAVFPEDRDRAERESSRCGNGEVSSIKVIKKNEERTSVTAQTGSLRSR